VRVYLPTRISPSKSIIFAGALFCIQLLEHTDFIFSILFFSFLVLSVIAFNEGGGFSRAGGAYVFFLSMLVVDIGVLWKAFLGEPADSNLLSPQLDMLCYSVSMFMLLIVNYLSKKLFGRPYGIAPTESDYSLAALGALVLGFVQTGFNQLGVGGEGSVLSLVNQLGQFFPLAILLGTITAVRKSGGLRTISFTNGCAMAVSFLIGVTGFSKQGMLTPFVVWFMGILFARANLRIVHYLAIACFAIFAFRIAPLIADGRNIAPQGSNLYTRGQVVLATMENLDASRAKEDATLQQELEAVGKIGYYNEPQGFIGRLTMISVDDAFLNYADGQQHIGYDPVVAFYANLIPHFIWPDKPVPKGGNYYAHRIGGFLAEDDDTTGISFSPIPEAYYIDGWRGLILLMPCLAFIAFASIDYICGDFRRTPWGLIITVTIAHLAPEGLLGGLVWLSGYGNLGLIAAIFACTEFVPVVGALFYGKARVYIPISRVPYLPVNGGSPRSTSSKPIR
jgi:hypothetical protein